MESGSQNQLDELRSDYGQKNSYIRHIPLFEGGLKGDVFGLYINNQDINN